jgi:lysophospholipase L1-like esterase
MRNLTTFGIALWLVFSCNSKMEESIHPKVMDSTNSNTVDLNESISNTNENELSSENNTTITNYLALGDSYTIGESVNENERWPEQLVGLLNKSGKNINKPKIIAASGWTTAELDAAIERDDIQQQFHIVSLLIGVNNQFTGSSLEDFRLEFRELLNKAIKFGFNNPTNVFVVSIPDWGVTPSGQDFDTVKITNEINLFNDVIREESTNRSVRFVDITDISRKALNDEIYVAEDGLHFSGAMYKLWAEEIARGF